MILQEYYKNFQVELYKAKTEEYMEENILVDILVATYNTEIVYLRKQLDSLISQSYPNIKIYISDDASNNNIVKDVLIEYEKKDKRIKVFLQEKNLGFNSNFEFLLKQSNAPYIMFCDHDDIWHKDKVLSCLSEIQKTNVDLVYSDATQINEKDEIIYSSYLNYKKFPIIEGKNKPILFARHTILGCTQMISSNVKNKMIPFKKSVVAHDWLSVVIANEGNGIKFINKSLIDYRLHSSNVFGGRNLDTNLNKWKTENGTNYKSFLSYRKTSIEKAYENGAKMSLDYCNNPNNINIINKQLNYLQKIKKHKFLYLNIYLYFKYLYSKGIGQRSIKEIVLFHFPILGFLKFLI